MSFFKEKAQQQNTELADYLRNTRINKRIPMRQLARNLNVSHSSISKIETSERRMDLGEFVVYCEALDLDPLETFKTIIKF